MPLYRFAGPQAYYFPASRDTRGVPLGDVKPGDVRDLDEPAGPWWVPADSTPAAEPEPVAEPASEPEPVPAPDGPQPAPPAIVA